MKGGGVDCTSCLENELQQCKNVVYHFHGTIQTIITSYLRPVNYEQATLLPILLHFNEDGTVKSQPYCIVSPSMDYCPATVNLFLSLILNQLKTENRNIEFLKIFSDS